MGLKGFKVGDSVEAFIGNAPAHCFIREYWKMGRIESRFPMADWDGRRSYLYKVALHDEPDAPRLFTAGLVRKPNDPVELRRLATIARLKRKEKKKPKPLRAHDLKGEF